MEVEVQLPLTVDKINLGEQIAEKFEESISQSPHNVGMSSNLKRKVIMILFSRLARCFKKSGLIEDSN